MHMLLTSLMHSHFSNKYLIAHQSSIYPTLLSLICLSSIPSSLILTSILFISSSHPPLFNLTAAVCQCD
uniref:Uncharacterized protein n=1 Tax=Octopus bimaculoides TaxID=37653 RepID=A0A0L8I2T4_OCTBM